MADLEKGLSQTARLLPESGIVELVNAGREKEGLMPLWVGEGHLPTPAFICEEATRSLEAGQTFYTWQRGIPPLRQALASYHEALYQKPFSSERFFITGSGMQSIQLCLQAVLDEGDEVLVPTPSWPNIASATKIAGGLPVEVPMIEPNLQKGRGWHLDIAALETAISEKTKVLFINSPSNPTGWTATKDELATLLSFARKHDLWILADEVYHRFYFRQDNLNTRAPSFYDIIEEDDKVLFANTFSKNWAMTGWRVGWISAPPSLGQVFENLIQFSTSGVAEFMQRAAITALRDGDDFVRKQIKTAYQSREILCDILAQTGRVNFAKPDGAFYLFFSIEGITDSHKTALSLINEALIGLAPGTAFGKGGGSYFRLCFARKPDDIEMAATRLKDWILKA